MIRMHFSIRPATASVANATPPRAVPARAMRPIVVLLLLLPMLAGVPHLPTYDIWNDGAKISESSLKSRKPARIDTQDRSGKSLAAFNFFSFGTEYECQAQDGRRSGLCINPYACRRRDGVSSGYCAHGFGVCCVFTTTCGSEIRNNITYFVSPQFPSISRSLGGCTLMIKKMDGASQLRLDFIHFNLGQPNRMTGACDSDVFTVTGGGSRDFKICGQNTDQHVYYDLDEESSRVMINLKFSRRNIQRLWEVKVTQIPFGQRAPAGCMQYHTTASGFIQTLNYADNGRHLANQDYKSCVRQESGMCSIAYEPCDSRSFRIGQNAALQNQNGVFSGLMGGGAAGGAATVAGADAPPVNVPSALGADEFAGSGDGAIPAEASRSEFTVPSPYAQYLGRPSNNQPLWRYWGYGNYGYGVSSFGRQRCQDRIVTPCDGDEFLGVNALSPSVCDPFHCGSNFCPDLPQGQSCRIETSMTPFAVSVKFGPPAIKSNPEDNIGMCLKYEQLPCAD